MTGTAIGRAVTKKGNYTAIAKFGIIDSRAVKIYVFFYVPSHIFRSSSSIFSMA